MKKPSTTRILGVNISITNMEDVIQCILSQFDSLKGQYICFSNVHTTVMSRKNPDYCRVQNNAFMALPDGSPVALVARMRGYEQAEQVAGPDFMPVLWKATENTEYKHYFYGGSPETIQKLQEVLARKYPDMKVVGMESPPYRTLTPEEDKEVVNRINASGADFVWVGLGAPKQERWMYEHRNRVHALMFGVGAGFDFHAGTVKRAPKWMREHYLEWFYRLMQDPKRLWKRYVVTNIQFVGLSIADAFAWKKQQDKDKQTILMYSYDYMMSSCSSKKLKEWIDAQKEQFEITIICSVPVIDGRVPREFRQHKYFYENYDGINILQVRVPDYRESFSLSRRWNKVVFFLNAIFATTRVEKQDFIYTSLSERNLNSILGIIGKRLKSSKLVVKDITPEQKEKRDRMHLILNKCNSYACRKANQVLVGEETDSNESFFVC